MSTLLTVLIVYALGGIPFAVFTGKVAAAKGYSQGNWAFAGFFFWMIALLAIVGMPLRSQNVDMAEEDEYQRRAAELNLR